MLKMFTILFKAYVHSLFNFKNAHCSISCCNKNSWLMRKFCQRCLRILLKSSQIINNFLRYWRSSMRFLFVDTASSNKSEPLTMFLELLMARYSCLQVVVEYIHSSFTITRQQWKCLLQENKPFSQSSLPNAKTKFLCATTKSFENDCFVVLNLDQRWLL